MLLIKHDFPCDNREFLQACNNCSVWVRSKFHIDVRSLHRLLGAGFMGGDEKVAKVRFQGLPQCLRTSAVKTLGNTPTSGKAPKIWPSGLHLGANYIYFPFYHVNRIVYMKE